jgi:hypothetical protein
MTEVAQIFVPLLCPKYAQNLKNTGLGYILSDFFTNSSGHPAGVLSQWRVEAIMFFYEMS